MKKTAIILLRRRCGIHECLECLSDHIVMFLSFIAVKCVVSRLNGVLYVSSHVR